jgi:argininosuccinate lyase
MSGPKGARGRRFEGALDPVAAALNASIGFDRRLLPHDVAGSIAHAEMLAAQGLISVEDAAAIATGLRSVARRLAAGELTRGGGCTRRAAATTRSRPTSGCTRATRRTG